MSAYTSGHWEVCGHYVRTQLDANGGGWIIADCRDVSMPRDEVQANMRLIVASKDLLAVAQMVIDMASIEIPAELIDAAHAAVYKATGEQS